MTFVVTNGHLVSPRRSEREHSPVTGRLLSVDRYAHLAKPLIEMHGHIVLLGCPTGIVKSILPTTSDSWSSSNRHVRRKTGAGTWCSGDRYVCAARNRSAARRPLANSFCWVDLSIEKSVAFTPNVSTKIVRLSTAGSLRCIWSFQLCMVPSIPMAKDKSPFTTCSTWFGTCCADNLIPMVGQRGGFPSVRSKVSTG